MAYVYKSSNPAEASFVENFFTEHGFVCQTVPASGSFGLPAFNVYVEGDVNEKLLAELNHQLENGPDDEPENEEEPSPEPAKNEPFSLPGIFGIMVLVEMMRMSAPLAHFFHPESLTRYRVELLADIPIVFFLYIYCRKKIGSDVRELFGFLSVGANPLLVWLSLASVYEFGFIFVYNNFPDFFPRNIYGGPWVWSLSIFLAPVGEEIICRGFLLGSLQYRMNNWAAVLVSAALFGIMHYHYPWSYQLMIIGSGVLLGFARVQTRSILPPIAMHALGNLMSHVVHF